VLRLNFSRTLLKDNRTTYFNKQWRFFFHRFLYVHKISFDEMINLLLKRLNVFHPHTQQCLIAHFSMSWGNFLLSIILICFNSFMLLIIIVCVLFTQINGWAQSKHKDIKVNWVRIMFYGLCGNSLRKFSIVLSETLI
jgi:hypothetical protein